MVNSDLQSIKSTLVFQMGQCDVEGRECEVFCGSIRPVSKLEQVKCCKEGDVQSDQFLEALHDN